MSLVYSGVFQHITSGVATAFTSGSNYIEFDIDLKGGNGAILKQGNIPYDVETYTHENVVHLAYNAATTSVGFASWTRDFVYYGGIGTTFGYTSRDLTYTGGFLTGVLLDGMYGNNPRYDLQVSCAAGTNVTYVVYTRIFMSCHDV
jgi:hypothetical protein